MKLRYLCFQKCVSSIFKSRGGKLTDTIPFRFIQLAPIVYWKEELGKFEKKRSIFEKQISQYLKGVHDIRLILLRDGGNISRKIKSSSVLCDEIRDA